MLFEIEASEDFRAMLGKGSKKCATPSHQALKGQAKIRVQDLHSMARELKIAMDENRTGDAAKLHERVDEILREWKAELDEPTPASSFLEGSFGSLGSFEQLGSLLKEIEELDDATSPLVEPPSMRHGNGNEHGGVHVSNGLGVIECGGDKEAYYLNHSMQQHEFQGFQNHANHVPQQHDFQSFMNHAPPQHEFQGFEEHSPQQHDFQGLGHYNGISSCQGTVGNNFGASGLNNLVLDNLHMSPQSDYLDSNVPQNFDSEVFLSFADNTQQWGLDDLSDNSGVSPIVNHPPSAFLGRLCAQWECSRPVEQGSDYCCTYHAELAVKECPPGTAPVLRPGGICLKDGPLILALKSKIEGKDVGIPECPGAATTRSPWKAPDLFDISILEGERIREWLFFDKPRRAFETGNRKQRSLPDHEGRGWHESRKLLCDHGGQKRSYYADPQPENVVVSQPEKNYDWHLYEYEVDNCDTYALYRLELKEVEEKKKSPKVKVVPEKKKNLKTKMNNDHLVDLVEKQMGRLTAVVPTENKPFGKGKAEGDI